MDVEGSAWGLSSLSESSIFILKFLVVSQSQVSLFVSCITSIPLQISSENNKKTIYINNNQKFNANCRS